MTYLCHIYHRLPPPVSGLPQFAIHTPHTAWTCSDAFVTSPITSAQMRYLIFICFPPNFWMTDCLATWYNLLLGLSERTTLHSVKQFKHVKKYTQVSHHKIRPRNFPSLKKYTALCPLWKICHLSGVSKLTDVDRLTVHSNMRCALSQRVSHREQRRDSECVIS